LEVTVSLLSQHLDRLRDDLDVHASRISELQKQLSMLEDEIAVHDWIVRLGRDPNVLEVLGQLADSSTAVATLKGKELETARSSGIELPPDCTVNVTEHDGSVTVLLEATHGKIPFSLRWNSQFGFSSGARLTGSPTRP
jgi:hypothetical protein